MKEESWIPIIKPYLQKVLDWDEDVDGDFIDFALKQVRYAIAMREENDKVAKHVLYHPFYKEECDMAVMCAFFYVIANQSPVDKEIKKSFEKALVRLANSRGYDPIYFKNRLMEAVGVPVRFVKTEQIEDFFLKKPIDYN